MKIRITQPGWAGYTGPFGNVEFADGVSVDDVSLAEAKRLAANVAIEADDGRQISPAGLVTDAVDVPAPILPTLQRGSDEGDEVPAEPEAKVYTVSELEKVADEKGIDGLREIANPLGIKARSIVTMIKALVSAGVAKAEEEAPPVAEPAEQGDSEDAPE